MSMLSNTEIDNLLDEIIKIEIDYSFTVDNDGNDEGEIYFSFNGYDDTTTYLIYMQECLDECIKRIDSNLLIMQSREAREDYIKNLWGKNERVSNFTNYFFKEFKEDGPLFGSPFDYKFPNGYVHENGRVVRINLPEIKWPLLEDFIIYNYHVVQMNIRLEFEQYLLTLVHQYGIVIDLSEEKKEFADYIDTLAGIKKIPSDTEKRAPVLWLGTPGEFGAIFNQLIQSGYIQMIKDKKATVNMLHKVFHVKNESGSTADADYLYRCFGDKIKNYVPGALKIPPTDNTEME